MSACPERSVWQRFSLGKLEDADLQPLITHLATCSICCETAEDLRTDDPLVAALRGGVDRTPREDNAGTQQLMERLRLLSALPVLEDEQSTDPRSEIELIQEYQSLLSPPQSADELGRLGERYRLLKVLGHGGMSVVFLADDLQLPRQVSLKIVKPLLANSLKANERFLFESRALARLDHPNIVTIYEASQVAGVPYLTMPYLHGETLRQRLQREGSLPVPVALRIAREIATGLANAHGDGLLHRDIKPENIFLESPAGADRLFNNRGAGFQHADSEARSKRAPHITSYAESHAEHSHQDDYNACHVKILDFGIARAFGLARESEHRASFTQTGTVIGTPDYMAPEQSRAGHVDHRADLFSLGCLLYEMLTGKSPFRRANITQTLLAVQLDPPAELNAFNAAVPKALSTLVLKLIAKDPSKRPDSADHVITAIAILESQCLGERWVSTHRETDVVPISKHKSPGAQSSFKWDHNRTRTIGGLIAASVFILAVWQIVAGLRSGPNSGVIENAAVVPPSSRPNEAVDSVQGELKFSTDTNESKMTLNATRSDNPNARPQKPILLELDSSGSATFKGLTSNDDEMWWFQVKTIRPGWLLVEALATGDVINTELTVFDTSYHEIAKDGNSGPGTDAQLVVNVEANETYLIAISDNMGEVGEYLLFVTQPGEPPPVPREVGEKLPNDSYADDPASAQEFHFHETGHASVAGTILLEGDEDWFTFVATQTGKLLIKPETPESSLDTFFQLYQGEEKVAEHTNCIVFQVTAGERYSIRMTANNPLKDNHVDPTGNYILRLRQWTE